MIHNWLTGPKAAYALALASIRNNGGKPQGVSK